MTAAAVFQISTAAIAGFVGHAYDCYPEECCGLLIGRPASNRASSYTPCENLTHSGKVYTINPKDHLRAEMAAEDRGEEILGVLHSHTHTEPYPSATDVAQAPDPNWHYVIVSLKRHEPEIRSYRIVDGEIVEERLHPV